MSFIPSDQPLRWLVGKQDMISLKQVSVSAKSPSHSLTARISHGRVVAYSSTRTGADR
jgi:hypothetical protein